MALTQVPSTLVTVGSGNLNNAVSTDANGNTIITTVSGVVSVSGNLTSSSSGFIQIASGTTAQRPSSPVNGMMRYNTTINNAEIYANGVWSGVNVTPPPVISVAPVVSGANTSGSTVTVTTGTWTNSPTGYYYQWLANAVAISNATSNSFTLTNTQGGANVSCNVTAYNVSGNSTPSTSNSIGPVVPSFSVSYLSVAGGGGGGDHNAGGGGAGGLLTSTINAVTGTVYTITVGSGGAGGPNNSMGSSGSNTTITSGGGFSNITCVGGGGGGGGNGGNGGAGGSGGAGSGAGSGGSGVSGHGYAGGPGAASVGGGGGGGASQVGYSINGGNGVSSTITGTALYYGGGGGGFIYDSTTGYGGSGGGGNGGYGGGGAGTANTGGGGGAANRPDNTGGAGGSGVVILSMLTSKYSGTTTGSPTVTTDGSNTVLKYTSSGSYTA